MENNDACYESNVNNIDININNIRCKLANSSKSNILDEYEVIRPNTTIHAGAAGSTTTAPAALNKNFTFISNQHQDIQGKQPQNVSNNVTTINNNINNLNSLNPNKKLASSSSSICNPNNSLIRPDPNSIETKSSTKYNFFFNFLF